MPNPLVRLRYAIGERFRRRRFQFFLDTVGQPTPSDWWLDLGGGSGTYFLSAAVPVAQLVLLDPELSELRLAQAHHPDVSYVCADGQQLPFKTDAFACIFCNSVIEHVPQPAALAAEIERTGRRYFVQTPNGRFPLESHSRVPIPFYRAFPVGVRRVLSRWFGASFAYLESVSYLTEADLHRLFPHATFRRESVLGLTKSFYAYRLGADAAADPAR